MSEEDPFPNGATGSVWCEDCNNWDMAFESDLIDNYKWCHDTMYPATPIEWKTYRKGVFPFDFYKRNCLGKYSEFPDAD